MSRVGRKRDSMARRDRGGTVRRDYDWTRTAELVKRRKALDATVKDPLNSFPLGRLFVLEEITERQYDAGVAWGEARWRWSQVNGIMMQMPRAIDLNRTMGRSLDRLDPNEAGISEAESARRLDYIRWAKQEMATMESVAKRAGLCAIREMDNVCVLDEAPGHVAVLKDALRMLSDMVLTTQPKSDKRRNAG